MSEHPILSNARVWLDRDGKHVWFAHDCLDRERVVTMLPDTWTVTGTRIEPSIHCTACGCHGFFDLDTDAPPLAQRIFDEKRADRAFMARIRARIEADKAILDRLDDQ